MEKEIERVSEDKMRCFFHNDLDGRCSAAIIYRFVNQNCEFIEVDYKDEIKIDEIQPNEEIIIVDFSFKPPVMEKVMEKTKRIVWIDHHLTAKDYPYLGSIGGLRDFTDKSMSGCELTWEYFCAKDMNGYIPDAVKFIGDLDKWALKYQPTCFEFYEGLKMENNGPKDEIWKYLFDKNLESGWVENIIENGKTAIQYRNNYCEDICKSYGYEIELDGYRGFAANIFRFGSQGYGERFQEYDFCAAYIHDGKNFTISLYSEKIDVSALVKKVGKECGALSYGGHKGASGMITEKLPF